MPLRKEEQFVDDLVNDWLSDNLSVDELEKIEEEGLPADFEAYILLQVWHNEYPEAVKKEIFYRICDLEGVEKDGLLISFYEKTGEFLKEVIEEIKKDRDSLELFFTSPGIPSEDKEGALSIIEEKDKELADFVRENFLKDVERDII